MGSVKEIKRFGANRTIRKPYVGFPPKGSKVNYLALQKAIFGSHIIQLFPFNDTSGTVVKDDSGNNCNGAYGLPVTLNRDGINGKCVEIGIDGYVNQFSSALASKFNPDEGYFSIWLKYNGIWQNNSTKIIVSFQADASNRIFLRTDSGSNGVGLVAAVYRGGSATSYLVPNMIGDRWVNLGLRWSKTDGCISVYINGLESIRKTGMAGTFAGSIVGTAGTTQIAALFSTADSNVKIQNSMLLDYAPTPADILRSFNPNGAIVLDGDSRTNTKSWNAKSCEVNTSNSIYTFNKFGFSCLGVGGDTTTLMLARQAITNAKIVHGKTNILTVWCGVNDNSTKTAQQIYDNLKAYCQNARAAGFNKIILCSEIDSTNSGWHAKYQDLNTLMYADHSFADDLADLGAKSELQNAANTTYFVDGTHLTAAGNDVVSSVITPIMEKYIV